MIRTSLLKDNDETIKKEIRVKNEGFTVLAQPKRDQEGHPELPLSDNVP